jgi:hypothetical protein
MNTVKIDLEQGLAALLPQKRKGLIFAVRPLLEQFLRAGSSSHRSSLKRC